MKGLRVEPGERLASLPLTWPWIEASKSGSFNRAASLRTGRLDQELERWRQAGGSLDVALLSVVKGDSRLQARGSLGLDEAHRLMGKLDLRTAGLESLVTQVVGRQLGADKGALIGGLGVNLLGGEWWLQVLAAAAVAVTAPIIFAVAVAIIITILISMPYSLGTRTRRSPPLILLLGIGHGRQAFFSCRCTGRRWHA